MTTVFVYEDVTATWAGGDEQSRPAQSLLAEGKAMLDAVTADFRSVSGVVVVTITDASFESLAAKSDYTLVIAPECDGRLEELAREAVNGGGRLLGPSPDAIRLTADKLMLARRWEAHGVATPQTWLRIEEPTHRPLVIKPRDGAGSQSIRLWAGGARSGSEGETFNDPRDVALASASGSTDRPLIAQAYIHGFAASVAFLIGPRSLTPLIPCAQHLSTDGRFQFQGGRLPIEPHLAERAIRIATAAVLCVPGLAGYVGVDVILGDDGRDWAIEINPRLTTSYVGLRALANFNIAEAMLAAVRGESLPTMEWHAGPIQFTPNGRVSPLAA
jgi:predicted ATP-grasp superfamily ATP-dependent carboligase